MIEKFKHYGITLFVLGIFLTGCGLWFIFNPQPAIDMPEEDPLVYMNITEPAGHYSKQVEVFEDGTVIFIRETWGDTLSPDQPESRLWKKGKLTDQELNDLIASLHTDTLGSMEECYICGTVNETAHDDIMQFTLHVNCGNVCATISALNYRTPDNGVTYPDLPDPIDDIYENLRYIGEYKTEEVCFEELPVETSH